MFPPIPLPWNRDARLLAISKLEEMVYGPCPVATATVTPKIETVAAGWEIQHVPFPVLVATPQGEGPWPTLIGLNFDGFHTLDVSELLPEPRGWTYEQRYARGTRFQTWPLSQITAAGWAVATAYVGDVEPDDATLSSGCAVSKWAQGLQSIARALELSPRFDAQRLVAVGHSRLGKAALLAAGLDERIAGVVSIQSGCGGAGPSRTRVGETVKDITTRFPHWFSPRFADYSEDPNRLPLDQHWLLALCASRPLLLCNASEDLWADPLGQHQMLCLAAEVVGEWVPDVQLEATVGNRLAHFYRPGRHEVILQDWEAILSWLGKEFLT